MKSFWARFHVEDRAWPQYGWRTQPLGPLGNIDVIWPKWSSWTFWNILVQHPSNSAAEYTFRQYHSHSLKESETQEI